MHLITSTCSIPVISRKKKLCGGFQADLDLHLTSLGLHIELFFEFAEPQTLSLIADLLSDPYYIVIFLTSNMDLFVILYPVAGGLGYTP